MREHYRLCGVLLAGLLAGSPGLTQIAPSPETFGLLVTTQSRPSLTVVGAGARPAGMGGAFTALADDASAASFNPAGLALLLLPEASVVFDARTRHDDFGGFSILEDGEPESFGPSSSTFSGAGINFAAFTAPFIVAERNLCLQLSYHRAIDFDFHSRRELPEIDGQGQTHAILDQLIEQNGDISTFSFAAAYQLTPRLSVGATLIRWDGGWDFATRTEAIHLTDDDEEVLLYRQADDWTAWGYALGMLLRYRYLNVGFSMRSSAEGDFAVTSDLETTFETPFEPSDRQRGTLAWPASWTLGLALKPLESWIVAFDLSRTDWDDMEIRGFGAEPLNFFDLQPSSETQTRHGTAWRVGTEVTVFPPRGVVGLRAGFFHEPRPAVLAPDDDDDSVVGWSLGAGWRIGDFSFDVAWQRAQRTAQVLQFVDPEAIVSGEVTSQAAARQDSREDRIFFSFLYQFSRPGALHDLFHFLFVGPLDDEPTETPAEKG